MMVVVSILAVLYSVQMVFYITGWLRATASPIQESALVSNDIKISVIIPVRNDAYNLDKCLSTIGIWGGVKIQFEIIVVNDHSEDDIDSCRNKYSSNLVEFIDLPGNETGKKAALTYGISRAKGEIIATIDADVIPCQNWILNLSAYLNNADVMLCTGPVLLKQQTGFLNAFQVLDNLGLMLITGGSITLGQPLMANGANLIFRKEAFYTVDGYTHTTNNASGDDTTLMQKIARHYGVQSIRFAKSLNTAVSTNAQSTLHHMLLQRQRWAGKALGFIYKRTTILLAFNYVYALSILWAFIAMLFTGNYIPFAVLLFTKLIMDSAVVAMSAMFYRQYASIASMPLCIVAHVPYVLWTGAVGILNPGKWKGRKIIS